MLSSLQLEDAGLAIALLVAGPVARGLTGSSSEGFGHIVAAIISIVAAIGAIAALATRVPGESVIDDGHGPSRMSFIGPYVGGIGVVTAIGVGNTGVDFGGLAMAGAMGAAVVGAVFANRLPVVSRPTRRLMVAPFVFVASGIFESIIGDIAGGFAGDLGGSGGGLLSSAGLTTAGFAVGLLVLASAVFYAMLVFAPRELADPGTRPLAWVVRYLVFVATLVVAVAIGQAGWFVIA
jgi:hypothetical protein